MADLPTHCGHGHRLTPENTYFPPSRGWQCRKCNLRRRRAINRKLKAARKRASALRKCVMCGRSLPAGLRADAQVCGRVECKNARDSAYWRAKHGKGRGPYRRRKQPLDDG